MSTLLRGSLAVMILAAGPALAQDKSMMRTSGWLEGRIREIQPTALERKFDTIAWVPTLHAALKLAKEHGRPVMLFTYDGQMQTGRC